ncbi:MAG: ferritin family protein [Candidatus Nealsonbacteria bacterium]|nr:ferritin family protein [Candidatus Nealsonbacteria bacterium]
MSQDNLATEILDFAIGNEEAAVELYRRLAAKTDSPSMREVFEGFAREEEGHKAKLLGVKQAGTLTLGSAGKKIVDLKIGDYLVDAEPGADLTYQDALILAMKQEKAAFKLYTDLAEAAPDAELRDLLLRLAEEEAKHKLRFEIEYDDHILTEN